MGVLLAAWGWFDVWCVQVGALIAAWVCAWVCLAGALRCCASCVECRAGPVLKSFHTCAHFGSLVRVGESRAPSLHEVDTI